MPKLKFFLFLTLICNLWAIPFNIEVAKDGSGDSIKAGQLIKVHYKGYLILDSLTMIEYIQKAKEDSLTNLGMDIEGDSLSSMLSDSLSKDSITLDTISKDTISVKVDSLKKDTTTKEGLTGKALADSVAKADSLVRYKNKWLYSSSYDGEPLEFALGFGQVIEGWEKGILGMKVGEIRYLTVPAIMAYGDRSLEGIPPNSDLYFEVELVHAEKPMEPDKFPENVEKLKWKEVSKGLKVYDEKVGSGKPAVVGATLKTHYTGWLLSGRKFGSSKDLGKPLEVVLGNGKLIKGWEQGLDGMKEGGIRWLRVAPAMGYGATAYTMIPSNSTLVFKVELESSDVDSAVVANMDFFPDTTTLTFENGSEGLRYAVIKTGEGEPAKVGSTVRVHYTGWLTNGYKFDSSRDRDQEFTFPLGGGRVIRGWELGVVGMLPGEKRILVIPPGLGYGARAAGPIPGGSTLIFAVEYLGD